MKRQAKRQAKRHPLAGRLRAILRDLNEMLLSLRSPAPAAREDSDKSPVRTGRCGHAVLYEPLRFNRLSGQVWECTIA